MTEKLLPMGVDENVVILSAVRYALGRGSYAVGSVIDHVIANKERLASSTKNVIIRDIDEYAQKYPDMRYKGHWASLKGELSK